MFTLYFKENQFVCGHNILTEGFFVTELSSDVGNSVRRTTWVTTHCRFLRDIFPKLEMVMVKANFTV